MSKQAAQFALLRATPLHICFSLMISGLAHATQADNGIHTEYIKRLLAEHTETLCAAASTFKIDPQLIVGVVLAENKLNVDRGDAVQTTYLKGLLATRNDAWFRQWKDQNELSARQC